jgi:hypothetical protein
VDGDTFGFDPGDVVRAAPAAERKMPQPEMKATIPIKAPIEYKVSSQLEGLPPQIFRLAQHEYPSTAPITMRSIADCQVGDRRFVLASIGSPQLRAEYAPGVTHDFNILGESPATRI